MMCERCAEAYSNSKLGGKVGVFFARQQSDHSESRDCEKASIQMRASDDTMRIKQKNTAKSSWLVQVLGTIRGVGLNCSITGSKPLRLRHVAAVVVERDARELVIWKQLNNNTGPMGISGALCPAKVERTPGRHH